MTKLLELTKDFKPSRPIFSLQLSPIGDRIDATLSEEYKFKPEPIDGDCLSELVCENYNEKFNSKMGSYNIDKHEIANAAMEDIRNSIRRFIEKNLQMKNPRQSRLYRWSYRNMPNGSEINDVFVMVYKYIRQYSSSGMVVYTAHSNHRDNALALLEAIMEKHEK